MENTQESSFIISRGLPTLAGFSRKEFLALESTEKFKVQQAAFLSIFICGLSALGAILFGMQDGFMSYVIGFYIFLGLLFVNALFLRITRFRSEGRAPLVNLRRAFYILYLLIVAYASAYVLFLYIYEDTIDSKHQMNITAELDYKYGALIDQNLLDISDAIESIRESYSPAEYKEAIPNSAQELPEELIFLLKSFNSRPFVGDENNNDRLRFENKARRTASLLKTFFSASNVTQNSRWTGLKSGYASLADAIGALNQTEAEKQTEFKQRITDPPFITRYEIFAQSILYGSTALTPFLISVFLFAIVSCIPFFMVLSIKPETSGVQLVEVPDYARQLSSINMKSLDQPENVELLEEKVRLLIQLDRPYQDVLDKIADLKKKKANPLDALNRVDEKLLQNPDDIEALEEKIALLIQMNRRDYIDILNRVNELKKNREIKTNINYQFRLLKLELFEMEFFGSMYWDFERTNILLGKNGYGKSHLLTLVIGLLQRSDEVCQQFFPAAKASASGFARLMVSIRDGAEKRTEYITYNKAGFLINSENEGLGIIPVLSISELRFIDKSRDVIGKPKESLELKNASYHFIKRLPLGDILDSRLYSLCLDLAESKGRTELLDIFQNVYERLTGDSFRIERAVRLDTNFQLLVRTEGTLDLIPIQKASQGTLSVLSMISLIYKYLELSTEGSQLSDSKKMSGPLPVTQHTGIVIIDEIDAHLHPSWQQKLIDILKDSFPNVQFIIASHSPLVVAGCKENEVNVLRKNDPSGFYIQQIRRHFIGSTVDELYKTIFEIEDRDETFKKYEAMIPLKESFKKEIKEIEGTRKILSDLEDTEYDELTTRQSMLEEQVQLFNKLKARPDLDEKERVIFDRLCQDLGLSPSSTSDEIKAKAQLGDKERERLSRLSRQIALEAPAQERLENLYSNVHYIEVVEKVKKGDTTKTN